MRIHATLTVLLLAGSLALWAKPPADLPVVMVVGDSLSAGYGMRPEQGWVALLERRLVGRYRVVNASISGDTTSGGLTRLPRALEVHRPAVVILELGGNDGLRGTSLTETQRNLQKMLEMTRAAEAMVVLVGMRIPPNLGPRYVTRFAQIFPQLAATRDVALVPFLLAGVATVPELMQEDGIHPNADAQSKLLDNVWPALSSLLEPMQ